MDPGAENVDTAGPLAHYFLLQIDINLTRKRDHSDQVLYLRSTIFRLAQALRTEYEGTKCLYKFKVTAEPKLIAVFEVENTTGIERISEELMTLGLSKVTCDPLIEYEYVARRLGVDSSLARKSPRNLKSNFAMWCPTEQEHHGLSTEEFLQIQKEEAELGLKFREEGLELELFRVAGKRTIHAFVGKTGEQFDDIICTLPIIRRNGHNTHMTPKSIQNLDDYLRHMSTLSC